MARWIDERVMWDTAWLRREIKEVRQKNISVSVRRQASRKCEDKRWITKVGALDSMYI